MFRTMPSCLFPHCKCRKSLYHIPRWRATPENIRGKRKHVQDEILLSNEVHNAWIFVLTKYVENFKYDANNRSQVICSLHFHPSVLYSNKRQQILPCFGAIPTLNLKENHIEEPFCKRSLIPDSKHLEIDSNLARPTRIPCEIPKRMQHSFDRSLVCEKIIEDKRLEAIHVVKCIRNNMIRAGNYFKYPSIKLPDGHSIPAGICDIKMIRQFYKEQKKNTILSDFSFAKKVVWPSTLEKQHVSPTLLLFSHKLTSSLRTAYGEMAAGTCNFLELINNYVIQPYLNISKSK